MDAALGWLAQAHGAVRRWVVAVLLLTVWLPFAAQSQVSQGSLIYNAVQGHASPILSANKTCASCHFANAAPNQAQGEGAGSAHITASNNMQVILNAFASGGVMTGYLGTTALDPNNGAVRARAFNLALYIGQYLPPAFRSAAAGACTDPTLAMRVRSGVAAVQDIYPCLVSDGTGGVAQDSGGLVISGQVNAPTVSAVQVAGSASMAYNLSYTSAAAFTGSASFNVAVVNPAATSGVSKTVPVTVYGVTSGTTATGVVGGTYSAGAPLYSITSNDPSATFSASLVSPSAALSTLGLSVDASGRVIGTLSGTPGTYTMRVQANISAATVGSANAGPVTKDVTLVVGGITSAAVVNYTQDQLVTPYQITSNLAITANSYTLSTVPPGMTFSTSSGQLSGTPTFQGTTNATIGASTASGPISQALQINVATAGPPVLTSNLPAAPTAMGTVNSSVNGSSYTLSANRPPLGSFVLVGTNPLPTGLSLNPSTGAITGTPTASGDFPVSFRTSNASGNSNQLDVTLRINPVAVPVISSAATASGSANQPFGGYQIVASNPVILGYEVVAPSTLPPNLSLDTSTGAITGTPTASGSFTTNLRASNAAGASAPFALTFTIAPTAVPVVSVPLAASPTATGTVGTAIAPIQITATNPAILSYGATGLPDGLSVNGAGQIVGTPTQSGDFTVTASATNVVGTGTAAAVTIRINPNAVPVISSASTASGNANQVFGGYQIVASNPVILAYAVVAPSTLPPGLSLNTSTGAITGTPTASGSFSTNLRASNAAGDSAPLALTFTIAPSSVPGVTVPLMAAPAVTGTVGTAIAPIQITATNPAILSYGATGLPGGLSVNGAGQIVGTPTESGDFTVTARATNSFGTGSAPAVTIRISPNTVPTITSAASVTRNVNAAPGLVYQITATNPVLTGFAVVAPSALPPGLSLNTATGEITGSPSASGPFSTVLSASNSAGTSAAFTLGFTINPVAVPVVSAPLAASPLVTGTVGTPIAPIQIAATNPAITAYGAQGLPGGLSVNASGQIVGTPTQSGDFAVTVSATNIVGTGTSAAPVTIRISPSTVPTITSAASVTRNVNAAPGLVYQITATNPVLTGFAVVAPSVLPPGLSLNTATGEITGSPSASGPFSTMLSASNSAGTSAAFTLGFTINPVAVPVVSAPLPASPLATGTVGTPIAPIQIAATNPAITAYGAQGLPGGLSVNASGQIVGTPTQSGDFAVTVSATNIVGTGFSVAPVTIRINPNTAPVIGSAATATATVNTAFGGYQIVANNGPITSYAVVAPSQLPAGLSLNTATGLIGGTPTASGSVQTLLSATNVSGTSAPFTLTFTVNPSSVPVITSPTFATIAAGVAIAPIQIVATNPAVLDYSATNLPPGLVLDAATGIITGTPTTPGSFSVVLGARNVVGTGNLPVPFNVGVPAPTSCAMSVPLNTPTTLDLASCLFAGFAPTGVTLLATPAHGTAVANGTRVTYTPVNNYFGPDSFTFVGTGLGGTSPQGTVTVTVTGRPDPMQDPIVTRVLTAQTEAAQRFAGAQIANFQRRMESLHRPPGGSAQGSGLSSLQPMAPAGAGGFASAATAATPLPAGTAQQPTYPSGGAAAASVFANGAVGPQTPGGITSLAANHVPTVASGSDVINALSTGLGLQSMPLAQGVISLVRNRSVNLAGVAPGLGLNTGLPNSTSTSYWVEGVATFGTRDASGAISGSEFSSDGITVGVDRRYGDTLALGMGLGHARDKTLIGTDGSQNRSKAYSLAVYGSYQPIPNTYIDALLGVASLDFDTRRFVAPMNDFAVGQRSGTQWFGSITGGYEFRDKNMLLSPYGRVDVSVDRLGSSTETGAGAFALTYFDQTNTSVQGALGMRAESIHATNFGYVVPRLRAEYRHEFRRAGQATVAYADQAGGTRFALAAAGGPRDSIALGLGSDFILRDGLTLSVEYQLSHSFANASTHALRLRLSKDFNVRGLPRLLSDDPESAHDEPIDVQLEAGAVYDDNVTRAKAGADVRGDHSYAINVSKTVVQPLSAQSRVLLIGTLGGEKFRRFNGLSRLSATAEAEYQYRASSEFDEPTYGAFARLTAEGFESSLRDGYRFSAGVSYRQALTDRINVFGAVSHNLRNANSKVFSTRENSVRGNIDYTLSNNETLYLGAEYRKGHIISTGSPSLESVSVAEVFAQDDAFPGGQMFSYRLRGSTVLLTMGYNLALGPRDSIDFSWRHIRATPGLRPSFVTSPRSYITNQLSATYLMRF